MAPTRWIALLWSIALLAAGCGGSAPVPTGPATLDLPDELTEIEAAIDSMDQACASAGPWTAAAGRFVAAATDLLERHRRTGVLDALSGTSDGGRASEQIYELAIFGRCDIDPIDATTDQHSAALHRAGEVSAAADSLNRVLADRPAKTSSPLWRQSDHLAQTIEMALIADEGQPIDTVVFGSSMALRAIDPDRLGQLTGTSVWNAGMAGLNPITLPAWVEQVEATLPQFPSTVVLTVATFEDFRRCDTNQRDDFRARTQRRADAFASLRFLDQATGDQRLLGGVPVSYAGPMLGEARYARFPEGSRGLLLAQGSAQIEELQPTTLAEFEATFRRPERCDLNREAIADQVVAWVDGGSRVLVVALPSRDQLIDMHPDGAAGHRIVIDDYRRVVRAAGGEFLDATALVDDSLLYDLVHLNDEGRTLLTDEVALLLDVGQS